MKFYIILFFSVFILTNGALAMPKNNLADALIKLDLSDSQKSQIAKILKESRPQVKPKVEELLKAKKGLRSAMHQENFDESAVRAAAKEVAKTQEELIVIRAMTVNKVIKVLEPEQKKSFADLRERMQKKAGKKTAGFRKLLNHWIDKNA